MADSVNPDQTATLEQSDLGYTLPKPVCPQNLGTFGMNNVKDNLDVHLFHTNTLS